MSYKKKKQNTPVFRGLLGFGITNAGLWIYNKIEGRNKAKSIMKHRVTQSRLPLRRLQTTKGGRGQFNSKT